MTTWAVQRSGEEFLAVVRNEKGQTIHVHPIPFDSEREAYRGVERLNRHRPHKATTKENP